MGGDYDLQETQKISKEAIEQELNLLIAGTKCTMECKKVKLELRSTWK